MSVAGGEPTSAFCVLLCRDTRLLCLGTLKGCNVYVLLGVMGVGRRQPGAIGLTTVL